MFSQNLKGVVVDSVTNAKLPFANITLKSKNIGTSTNEQGFFKLDLNNKAQVNDTLLVSYIGYKDRLIPLKEITTNESVIFKLEEETTNLKELTLTTTTFNNNAVTLGITVRKTIFPSSVPFGHETAVFIKNKKFKKGKIKSISFKLNEKEESDYDVYKAYYRLNFYEVTPNNEPGNLICFDDILIKPKKNQKNVTIDLESNHIVFQEKGFFVGIETINSELEYPKNSMYATTPNVMYTHIDEKLEFSRFRKKEWSKSLRNSPFKKKLYSVPFIKVKVQYEE